MNNNNSLLSILAPLKKMIIPIVALLALLIFNAIFAPDFFSIALNESNSGFKVLSGNLITVLDSGTELVILAIGMTLVTAASGGQDISVGATIVIAGSVIIRFVNDAQMSGSSYVVALLLGIFVACIATMLCGAFNGVLVAVFNIQPMIATLILFTAGRSIGSWILEGANVSITNPAFKVFGEFIPKCPVPTPFIIAVICIIIIMLVLKFTTLGLYVQSVGINERSSKLNGINPTVIKIISFIILGVCVCIAGLIKASRAQNVNFSTTAKDIEMDAILAVALGGNALSGGKFSIASSILGAYVIQLLQTTLYAQKVDPVALPAYKAIVVIVLVVLGAPIVREKLSSVWSKIRGKKEAC